MLDTTMDNYELVCECAQHITVLAHIIKGRSKLGCGSLGIKKFRCRRPPQPPLSFQLFKHGKSRPDVEGDQKIAAGHPTDEQTIHRHIGTIEYNTQHIRGRGGCYNAVAREWRNQDRHGAIQNTTIGMIMHHQQDEYIIWLNDNIYRH